ncbi:hypothetical protein GCM10020358_00070 [Amorphoplanes nipponensis]|uniref:Sulphotransferase Stf0 domain-containing protein n=1 Tax=Actinoplanes nipponensis TaxID=135950 RepID=A0A919MJ55_9ACTN|nr:hypothetical protein Ani05nite_49880 [Actinoplanes nipponensis]
MAVSCLLCATPRTGSSLLLGLLASTGIAGHPEAYFRAQGRAAVGGPVGRHRAARTRRTRSAPLHRRQADRLNVAWAARYRTGTAR